jgi:thiol-disulfide isomerase/thioredoxin
MKKLVIILLSFLSSLFVNAQSLNLVPLKVGDKVPNVFLSNFLKFKNTSAHISDFKGKLLILDFWGVTCGTCIAEMPHLVKLQQEFSDKIQILLVTSDSKQQVEQLFKRSGFVRNINLPFVVGDRTLIKLFPSHEYGLHVWIDGNSIVKQKTDFGAYSSKQISAFLSGQKVSITQNDQIMDFDPSAPLWLEGNGRQVNFIKYSSMISGNIGKVRESQKLKIDSANRTVRYRILNKSILILYRDAFPDRDLEPVQNGDKVNYYYSKKENYSRIVLEVNDSSKYLKPTSAINTDWAVSNSYCYEIELPLEKQHEINSMMRQDLERYFDLSGSIQKRKVKCWALVRTSPSDTLFKADSTGVPYNRLNENEDLRVLHKQSFDVLSEILKGYLSNTSRESPLGGEFIYNETGYKGLIDFVIPVHRMESLKYPAVINLLHRYGLDLKEEEREMDCLVLREKGYIDKSASTSH